MRHSNGLSLVQGQTITSFTNAEEAAGNFYNVVPFLLETKLRMLGAHFVSGPNFKPNVQVKVFLQIEKIKYTSLTYTKVCRFANKSDCPLFFVLSLYQTYFFTTYKQFMTFSQNAMFI